MVVTGDGQERLTLAEVNQRAEEQRRAEIEKREPDFSEENLALNEGIPPFVNTDEPDTNGAEPQAVTSDPDADTPTLGFFPEEPHVPVNEVVDPFVAPPNPELVEAQAEFVVDGEINDSKLEAVDPDFTPVVEPVDEPAVAEQPQTIVKVIEDKANVSDSVGGNPVSDATVVDPAGTTTEVVAPDVVVSDTDQIQ